MEDTDSLLLRQKQLIASIQKIQKNFNKDSAHRKTETYLLKRVKALESLWAEFEMNHAQLLELPDKSNEYFTKNIQNDTKILYTKIHKILSEYNDIPGDNSDNEDVEQLLKEQRTNFRAFTRQIKCIKVDDGLEKWEMEDDLKSLQMRWNNIDTLHLKIDTVLMGDDKEYDKEYYDMEAKYRSVKRSLNQKIAATAHQYASTPKMEVPAFYGDYNQWPTFLDLYKSSIHDNPNLIKAQKMQHLKGKLKGEALRLVQHLHVTADNYETAWTLLYHRYNNEQVLFNTQIEIFLNQPVVQKQTSSELKRLHDTTMECIHAIHNLGIDTTTWDPLIVHLLVKKLDPATRSDYKESRKSPRDLPKFDDFIAFLEAKFTALEPMYKKEREDSSSQKPPTFFKKHTFATSNKASNYRSTSFTSPTNIRCVLCNVKNHAIYQCRKFTALAPEEKMKTISKHGLCSNCLHFHERNVCNSKRRCLKCSDLHNTMLHEAFVHPATDESPSTSKSHRQQNANHVANCDDNKLLATMKLRVRTIDNTYITLRALLDPGSETNLVSESCAQRLGLPRHGMNASITGIGCTSKRSKGKILLNCKSIHDEYELTTEALVMPKLLNYLPHETFERKAYPHIEQLQLADPDYNVSKEVDMLLDVSVYSHIIMGGLIKISETQPIAQQTKFGWIISGPLTKTLNCNVVINHIDDISKYWEMEDISKESATTMTEEDQFCENLYVSTTKRLPDGRYEVRLPMKDGFESKLGQSKNRAAAQFLQMERRMISNEKLRTMFRQFMIDYKDLGHMKECTVKKYPMYYIPYHGIVKETATTTPFRSVFNASMSSSTGYSLNDLMERGPKLQQDIQDLLLRWRTYPYVYTADCEKMYRCILVQEDQQHLQKIVWREDPHDLLKEYQLCTVTYGLKAAPFLAMRTMIQLAKDDAQKYPLAAKVLERDFYVDDLLSGSQTLEHAREVQKQLIDMLKGAGINLRKWSSNNTELLAELDPQQINPSIIDFKNENSMKTLGLRWNPNNDMFTFHKIATDSNKTRCTKRVLLSEISRVFDPLGWLSPLTIRSKLLFQKVWLVSIDWDDEVPQDIQQEWNKIREDLQNIDKFDIPRWIGNMQSSLELHGFCDSSEKAMACAIYLKSTNETGNATVRLIAAKTKVAPRNKTVTLPRLELCGALLLSALMSKVKKALIRDDIPVFGWTDSLVVLGWLQGNPSRWKTFVANRTKEILDIMPVECWRHVSSQENAADCATRGLTTSQLINHKLWWEGPSWVKNAVPECAPQVDLPQIEMKKETNVFATQLSYPIIEELLCKHSSITHIVRVVGYISRFITNMRHRLARRMQRTPPSQQHDTLGIVLNAPNSLTYLTSSEIENAYRVVIKAIQVQEFQTDITQIRKNGTVTSKSNLLKLNPYLEENTNLLRVGGRLEHSKLTDDAKHPMIIPKDSRLTELLINHAHLQTLHGGPTLTLAYLRQKYWVLGGNRTVKKYLRTCVRCFRFRSHNYNQLMSDLPEPRVSPSKPFSHCGVDFTGAIPLKVNKGRGIKTTRGYVAIFVCFATKAIHIELVSELTTAAFLGAFTRMTSRRGTPKHLYSDNGTNFVGAARVLKKEYEEVLQSINDDCLKEVSNMGVTWHFNAPIWPSAGGLWESAVRSTKHHLKRVLGDQILTFEELYTLLAQIEACLNSRPLYAITENADDDYLTPGHFLVGQPLLAPPRADPYTKSLKSRWQLVERMQRDFWKKWSSEYLHYLQMRSKWNHHKKDLKINDIVLIKEENLPPTKWTLGKVEETHPGKDGHVRVVTLRTKSGTTKRPIIKLAPLPIQEDDTSESSVVDENELDTSAPRRLRRNRRKPNMVMSILLLLLTFVTPFIKGMTQISPINNNNSLYFDKIADIRIIQDEWKMVVFYNMTTYWHSVTAMENYVKIIENRCRNYAHCLPITAQYQQELDELRHYNKLLYSQQNKQRRKRGLINGIGYVANTLFGVLDDRFAQKYESDIETIQKREDHLFSLFKNQTSILEAENNILKRNEAIMNKHFEMISRNLNIMEKDVNRLQLSIQNAEHAFHILSSLITADVMISSIRRIQETLIDTVTDIYHGRLNIHLLSPEQIQQQLNLVSGHIQDELIVPADTIQELYGLLHIQAKVTKKFLIMEIKIPLLNRDSFELDEIIDMPIRKENQMVYTTTETKYLAINLKKDATLPMSETDLHSCLHHTNGQMLCPMNHPLYIMRVGESICNMRVLSSNENKQFCRSKLQKCNDRWIKLHSRDTWLFSCCEECSIRILCPADVITKRLRGNGLISLDQGCVIKGESFIIHAQHDYTNKIFTQPEFKINGPSVSSLNDIINTSVPINFASINHDNEYQEIQKKIDILKHQELQPISQGDTTHYAIIYVILCIILIIMLPVTFYNVKHWWKAMKRKRSNSKYSTPARRQNDIGLQELKVTLPPFLAPPKPPRMTSATQASTTSLDAASSPIPQRKISFNVINESDDSLQ